MKPICKFLLISSVICSLFFGNILSANLQKNLKNESKNEIKQVHLVNDLNGFKSELNHVVRRSPTVQQ